LPTETIPRKAISMSKHPAAVELGKRNKGRKKTMSPEAMRQRKEASLKPRKKSKL